VVCHVLTGRDSDLHVSKELSVTGTVTGSIIVHSGGALVLLGHASGGVTVRGGGFARIYGTTNGLLVATGGHAVLAGTCWGTVTNDGGELLVLEDAVTEEIIERTGRTDVKGKARVHDYAGLNGQPSRPGARKRFL
jgi:hypothetical protein